MKKIPLTFLFFVTACSPEALSGATENAQLNQMFNIHVAGQYNVQENCPSDGGQVVLKTDYFRLDHSVCDVDGIAFSEDPLGQIMKLNNCRDDNGEHDSSDVTIVADDENNMTLVGWGKDPVRLYRCEANK